MEAHRAELLRETNTITSIETVLEYDQGAEWPRFFLENLQGYC
jgi:hypothetical protein